MTCKFLECSKVIAEFIILYLILRCAAKRSLEGRMACTGSSFEARQSRAPQDEGGGFRIPFHAGNPRKSVWFNSYYASVATSRIGERGPESV